MQTLNRSILAAFLGMSVLIGLFVKYVLQALWNAFSLPIVLRGAMGIAEWSGLAVAAVTLIIFLRSERIKQFSTEVYNELVKVSWPLRKETMMSAVVISVMVAICAMILFTFDAIWGVFVKVIY